MVTPEADMMDDMGTFRIDVEIENPAQPGIREAFAAVLVDTGAELSVFPSTALERLGNPAPQDARFPAG